MANMFTVDKSTTNNVGNNTKAGKDANVDYNDSTTVKGDGNIVKASTAEQNIGNSSEIKGDQTVNIDNSTKVYGDNNTVYDTQAAAYQKRREELEKQVKAGGGDYGNVFANAGMGLLKAIPVVGWGVSANEKSKAMYAQGELDALKAAYEKALITGQISTSDRQAVESGRTY